MTGTTDAPESALGPAPGISPRPGLLVAGLGGIVELVGMIWDATRHVRDPGLAAREELFSFGDPSHSLLFLGIALAVGGLAFELIFATPSLLGGLHGGGVVVGVTLIALLAANAGVALVGSSAAPSDEHPHGASAIPSDPTSQRVAATLRARGLPAALDELATLAQQDQEIERRGHDLAHMIGELAAAGLSDPAKVIQGCRDTFLYGCYHGALRGYFASKGKTRPADVIGICPASIGELLRFQCLHGLGHGVLTNLEYDLFRALLYCDALGSEQERRSCYGGVFMENIVLAIDQVGGRATGDRAAAPIYLRPSDPHYPCDVVAEKYRPSCYQLQTSGMLLYNGRSYADAARVCDAAPRAYIAICLESLGRDVSGDSLRDDGKTIRACDALPSPSRGQCFVGAVRNLGDSPERVIPFCRQTPEYAKGDCYNAAGEHLGLNYRDPARRTTACAAAEAAYVRRCEDGIARWK